LHSLEHSSVQEDARHCRDLPWQAASSQGRGLGRLRRTRSARVFRSTGGGRGLRVPKFQSKIDLCLLNREYAGLMNSKANAPRSEKDLPSAPGLVKSTNDFDFCTCFHRLKQPTLLNQLVTL
jgi:hypothetical protein